MTRIDFREEIKKRMKRQKINIPELARRAELNVNTVYNFFAGRSEMTSGNLEIILEILQVQKIE